LENSWKSNLLLFTLPVRYGSKCSWNYLVLGGESL